MSKTQKTKVTVDTYNIVFVQNGVKLFQPKGCDGRYYRLEALTYYSNGEVHVKGKRIAMWYYGLKEDGYRDTPPGAISFKNKSIKSLEAKFVKAEKRGNRFHSELWNIVREQYEKHGDHYIVSSLDNVGSESHIHISKGDRGQTVPMYMCSRVSNIFKAKIVLDPALCDKLEVLDELFAKRRRRNYRFGVHFVRSVYDQLSDKDRYNEDKIIKLNVNGKLYHFQKQRLIREHDIIEVTA